MKVRRSKPKDIVEGNQFIFIGDDDELFVLTVAEVHNPTDDWKAFTAKEDGCRCGHSYLWVIEEE